MPAAPEGDHSLSDSQGGAEGRGQGQGPGGGQPREGGGRDEVTADEDEGPSGPGNEINKLAID